MPYIAQTGDLTAQYKAYLQQAIDFRPAPTTTYTPGLLVQLASQDLQVYPDFKTVALPGTGAGQTMLVGFVSAAWPGFNGSIGTASYTSGSNTAPGLLVRGTGGVLVVTQGYHPAIFLDQSGTGAVTVTNGIPVIASRATAGYVQGVAVTTAEAWSQEIAIAALPASGIGSSLTAAALAQASQTATVATPAAGDQLNLTIQSSYVPANPGVAQTTTWSLILTTAAAVSATTAAAAMIAYLNAQPSFSQYFTATAAAGVITVTVNALANPFTVNFGSGSVVESSFSVSISGMVANSLTFACTVTGAGGTTFTAGAANLASGTGYKGTIPAWVQ